MAALLRGSAWRLSAARRLLWQPAVSSGWAAAAARPLATSAPASDAYARAMESAWRSDPSSVPLPWARRFEGGYTVGSSDSAAAAAAAASAPAGDDAGSSPDELVETQKVARLIRAFQVRGHNTANLDPLGIFDADLDATTPIEMEIEHYGFSKADLDREFWVPPMPAFDQHAPSRRKLADILDTLRDLYCGHIGVEYMYLADQEQRKWLRERFERPTYTLSDDNRKQILQHLVESNGLEEFLQTKFPSEKRFGLDGAESLIPGMKNMIDVAADLGVGYMVIGMAHRGRLNVLRNVMQKPLGLILQEISSTLEPGDEGSGDVMYHLGMSSHVQAGHSKSKVNLSLLANPSHLEAVNPVVTGKARARQDTLMHDEGLDLHTARQRVMPVLIHGDAAMAGQGVVFETIGLGDMREYATGGTVHVVINNQIGFTTDPRFSRSNGYCTEVCKVLEAPIFHVNGDDPEAVARSFQIAAEYRQQFQNDVVIDLICYRRYGHNEADMPEFTQPRMYKVIHRHPNVRKLYVDKLVAQGTITHDEATAMYDAYRSQCNDIAEDVKKNGYKRDGTDQFSSFWKHFKKRTRNAKIFDTGVDVEVLRDIGIKASSYPEDFKPHSSLAKVLKKRISTIEEGEGIDWATGEALAFGTLLLEGNRVRLSGQDVERGTFSHRHHILHDQKVDKKTYCALQHLSPKQGPYTVCNSHLSEYGVLGFELGYSLSRPETLVCWEAQFGDFSNTAQCMIDQFIASGEDKWTRQSALTLLLPHGFEGMGPEHSSARLERFLQQSKEPEDVFPEMDHLARTQIEESNWQVVNCTTPANYFHVLRRQLHRQFRKPLVVMTPKSLLRLKAATSSLADMAEGTRFLRLIPETDPEIMPDDGSDRSKATNPDVKRVIFCSGKVYYDLLAHREELQNKSVALARVEQISPFPFDLVKHHADNFPNAEVVWCQEEPRNMGAWSYVRPRIETALTQSTHHSGVRPRYIGRPSSASPATGAKKEHVAEQELYLRQALVEGISE